MNNKVMYVGKLSYGKIFKSCEDKAEALVYHFDSLRKGVEIKSYATFPLIESIVHIDRLSHIDMSDQLAH